MKNILVIGAGLSASTLIKYLLDNSYKHNWKITLGEIDYNKALKKINGHPNGKAIHFDVFDDIQRHNEVSKTDLVVSMLPSGMHTQLTSDCVKQGKNMVTTTYISDQIMAYDSEVRKAGVLLLNEIGVDPGIDHMSAMRVINNLKEEGAEITSFRSFTGGLIAPKYDNNPWNYKFTWAPRNVVLAGQSTAQAIINGIYKYIPYHKLFSRTQRVNVPDCGEFEAYINRNSLKYRSIYGLENIPTMVRGTLRRPGFCKTWDIFVQLGITDDTFTLENSENMTYHDFLETFVRVLPDLNLEQNVAQYSGLDEDSMPMYRLRWLGLFDNKRKIGLKNATPAQILQQLLEEKWEFEKEDRDMIVMQHQFCFIKNGQNKRIHSSMVVEGDDNTHTAISKTVGLSVAIAVKQILTNKIKLTGVHIPTKKEIYQPVLNELEEHGIKFIEEEINTEEFNKY